MATPSKWEKLDKSYALKSEYCYPGTVVEIRLAGYKKWIVILVNTMDKPQTEDELSRKPGRTISRKAWATAATAKQKALAVYKRRDWLSTAGITFKEEK